MWSSSGLKLETIRCGVVVGLLMLTISCTHQAGHDSTIAISTGSARRPPLLDEFDPEKHLTVQFPGHVSAERNLYGIDAYQLPFSTSIYVRDLKQSSEAYTSLIYVAFDDQSEHPSLIVVHDRDANTLQMNEKSDGHEETSPLLNLANQNGSVHTKSFVMRWMRGRLSGVSTRFSRLGPIIGVLTIESTSPTAAIWSRSRSTRSFPSRCSTTRRTA